MVLQLWNVGISMYVYMYVLIQVPKSEIAVLRPMINTRKKGIGFLTANKHVGLREELRPGTVVVFSIHVGTNSEYVLDLYSELVLL